MQDDENVQNSNLFDLDISSAANDCMELTAGCSCLMITGLFILGCVVLTVLMISISFAVFAYTATLLVAGGLPAILIFLILVYCCCA
ncbi:MAG: hypothetical protein WDZ28_03505 [Simkaniaceae bacterium]